MVNRQSIEVAPGVELSFMDYGEHSSATTFVLVHGLASNARMWDGVAVNLAAGRSRALSVDQRGHGDSARPSHGFDFATLTADLARLVESEVDGPVIMAGQSWGGNVALEFGSRRPDLCAAVVCVDGGFIRIADQFASWDDAAEQLAPPDFSGFTVTDLEAMTQARFAGWPMTGVDGQLANFEEADAGLVRPRLSREDHMSILSVLWAHDPHAIAAGMRPPVMVVAVGQNDPDKRRRVESFVDALTIGELMWLDGDHDIHAQRPDLVARVMLDFATEVT